MPAKEKKLFELSATYLEFIISTQTMTPVKFSNEEMTIFHKKHVFKTACFWTNDCPVLQRNWYDEEVDKILFIVAK